jgi:indolepyruvate ferredoxin oxidoreductase alpha subunit
MNQALELSENSPLNKIVSENSLNEYGLGIITSGVSFSYVLETLEYLQIKAPILKLGFIHPLPERKIAEFLKRFKHIFVVEENDAYLETQILAIAQTN